MHVSGSLLYSIPLCECTTLSVLLVMDVCIVSSFLLLGSVMFSSINIAFHLVLQLVKPITGKFVILLSHLCKSEKNLSFLIPTSSECSYCSFWTHS